MDTLSDERIVTILQESPDIEVNSPHIPVAEEETPLKPSPVLLIPGVSGSILNIVQNSDNSTTRIYPVIVNARTLLDKYLQGYLDPESFTYETQDPVSFTIPFSLISISFRQCM